MVNREYLAYFVEVWMKESGFVGSMYDVFPRFRDWRIEMHDRDEAIPHLIIKTRMGGVEEKKYLAEQVHLFNAEWVDVYHIEADNTYMEMLYDMSDWLPRAIMTQMWQETFVGIK